VDAQQNGHNQKDKLAMTRTCVGYFLACLSAACVAASAAEPRADSKPEKYFLKESANQAQVVTATFLGGKGHEWLVGGGWQPDGSVVLAGNVLGPKLELGAAAAVIGADLPPPQESTPPEVQLGDRAKPFPVWNLPNVTGFVVRCSADLKKVVSVHRLPWTSGAITAAVVDNSGAVYIAGPATEQIAKLGGRPESVKAAVPDAKPGACNRTFLAKIASDLAKCEWLLVLEGPSSAPQLRLLADGNLWLLSQDARTIDAAGKTLKAAVVPGGPGRDAAPSPVDGRIARNASRGNWRTGREPWKCPGVRILRPDGTDLYHLYEWDGPYVGLDNHRSVADTTVQNLVYDYDGNLLLYTWSDGGNEVMRYRSTDIRRLHGCQGLPFHWGGTGYNIVKLEGRDYQTVASTKWRAETARGSGLMRMSTLRPMADGSVCVAGTGGPRGLRETTSSLLPEGPSGGNYVAVLAPSLATARFSSVVGGAGEIDLGNGAWGTATGKVGGRTKYLLLSGAKRENEPNILAPDSTATPTRSAMQPAFGGGALDGYAILLDVPDSTAAASGLPQSYPRLSIESRAVAKKADPLDTLADGTVFYFQSDYPKFVTADAEFRHAADSRIYFAPLGSHDGGKPFDPVSAPRWPNFLYGRSVTGEMKWVVHRDRPDLLVEGKTVGRLTGSATVGCSHWVQVTGDQDRRVLGELISGKQPGDFPAVTFTLSGLSEMKALPKDPAAAKKTRPVAYADGKGRLELAGRVIECDVKCLLNYAATMPDKGPPGMGIEVFFTVRGNELGLPQLADEGIDVRIGMRGTLEPAPSHRGR
jgi:hypothetical protein